ncbi:testis-expressed protein 49-like [Xiphophorus maculatus]|uniref:testis-expressed protein 49-like n=1 Tax=Xiphophorus maculatus TaxID=8083 RepID=UPI000C6E38A1|nr:testis-expressed protein 49-like [Xiphophorus maculatus]XP_027866018.1 testis-expressed protein 49 [Xiphophorus couchianus]XP_032429211.1 testis-expressed protein 49 [Xiphophorus hellerii]
MTFFGLTQLGYQNPIGDNMLINPRGVPPSQDDCFTVRREFQPLVKEQGTLINPEVTKVLLQPHCYSVDDHRGSHQRYAEMVKKAQPPRLPNQLYVIPLTENQKYGWMRHMSTEPWTQCQRFPQKISEMTRFVGTMTLIHRDFSLF